MINKSLFSSKKDDWETPQWLFDELDREFKFTLDPCANENNYKCNRYFSIQDNGLVQSWKNEVVFCNPPYGRGIYKWIKKSYEEMQNNNVTVVLLIPSRTDTKYFHEFLYNKPNVELRFVKGRIKFVGGNLSAPFPSLIAIMKKRKKD